MGYINSVFLLFLSEICNLLLYFFDAVTCVTLTSSTVACVRVMSAVTEHGTKAPSE